MQNLSLGSYHKVATRDEGDTPTVGPFSWDLTAPSYLSFMIRKHKDGSVKPGFVVCDILLGKPVTVQALRPFLTKCKTLRSVRNLAPSMQIFVADNYTPDAFDLAKKQGIIPATTQNLFGSEVGESLAELISILSDAAEHSVEPEAFDRLLTSLSRIEGTSIQLRGALFEFIAADLARKTIAPNVRMNQNIRTGDGKETEADVIAIRENHSVCFIECKGYNPNSTIPDDLVIRWLHHNIPILYDFSRKHPDWSKLSIHFELWITGSISHDAKRAIESAQSTIKATRYTLGLKTGADILGVCESTRDHALTNVFRKHYTVK